MKNAAHGAWGRLENVLPQELVDVCTHAVCGESRKGQRNLATPTSAQKVASDSGNYQRGNRVLTDQMFPVQLAGHELTDEIVGRQTLALQILHLLDSDLCQEPVASLSRADPA